jgi:hypothetical protein
MEARHQAGLDDHVLENLVDSVSHVDIAVGVGRPIVENPHRPAGGMFLNSPVQVCISGLHLPSP